MTYEKRVFCDQYENQMETICFELRIDSKPLILKNRLENNLILLYEIMSIILYVVL